MTDAEQCADTRRIDDSNPHNPLRYLFDIGHEGKNKQSFVSCLESGLVNLNQIEEYILHKNDEYAKLLGILYFYKHLPEVGALFNKIINEQ